MKNNLKVLILEDIPSDVELAKRELTTVLNDPTTKVVDTEDDFIRDLKEFKPDLIISDYRLPTFDGLSALKIRQELSPFTPFVMLTGSVNEEIAVECMKAGADDYVIKEHVKRLGSAILNSLEKKKIELERRNTENKLVEANKNLEILGQTVRSVNECVSISDKEHKIIFVNNAFLKTYGYKRNEIIGKTSRLLQVEETPELLNEIRRKTEQGGWKGELFNRKKDGTIFPIELSITPLSDTNKTNYAYIGVSTDITERKQAENEKRENQQKMKILYETAIQFVEFPSDSNIYQFIGKQLKKLIGKDSYIITSSIDKDTNTLSVRTVLGMGELAGKIIKILGKNPTEITLIAKDENLNYLSDGLLHNAGKSIGDISFNTISKPVSRSIEKIFKIGKIYTIGFTNKEQLFGTAIIVLKKDAADIKTPEIIETFIKQASIAIIKMQAEEKLISRNKELELFNEVTVGRELKMIELKKEINQFLKQSGKKPKYDIPV